MFETLANAYCLGIIPQYIMQNVSGGFATAFLIAGGLLCALVGYFFGSFNFALILSKKMYNEDIRNYGSKNAGTTNMMRTYGKKAAFLTILGDILKAVAAVAIGCFAMGINFGGYLTGLFCVIGHVFPAYYGFKGLCIQNLHFLYAFFYWHTPITVSFMLNPFVFLCVIGVFVITVLLSRYVSLGSVLAAAVFPLLTYTTLFSPENTLPHRGFAFLFSFVMAVIVIVRHKENLSRLAHGTESKFSFKRSKKPTSEDKK